MELFNDFASEFSNRLFGVELRMRKVEQFLQCQAESNIEIDQELGETRRGVEACRQLMTASAQARARRRKHQRRGSDWSELSWEGSDSELSAGGTPVGPATSTPKCSIPLQETVFPDPSTPRLTLPPRETVFPEPRPCESAVQSTPLAECSNASMSNITTKATHANSSGLSTHQSPVSLSTVEIRAPAPLSACLSHTRGDGQDDKNTIGVTGSERTSKDPGKESLKEALNDNRNTAETTETFTETPKEQTESYDDFQDRIDPSCAQAAVTLSKADSFDQVVTDPKAAVSLSKADSFDQVAAVSLPKADSFDQAAVTVTQAKSFDQVGLNMLEHKYRDGASASASSRLHDFLVHAKKLEEARLEYTPKLYAGQWHVEVKIQGKVVANGIGDAKKKLAKESASQKTLDILLKDPNYTQYFMHTIPPNKGINPIADLQNLFKVWGPDTTLKFECAEVNGQFQGRWKAGNASLGSASASSKSTTKEKAAREALHKLDQLQRAAWKDAAEQDCSVESITSGE